MPRLFVLSLASLLLRSLLIGGVAGILMIGVRRASIRHAGWAAVLGCLLLMPLADALLPKTLAPAPLESLAGPVQTFVILAPIVPLSETPLAASPEPQPQLDGWGALSIVVVLVAAALLTRMALAYLVIQRMKRRSRSVPAASFDDIFEGARYALPLPEIRESAAAVVPLTVGYWKPILVLPSDWRSWELWKLRAVLFHELTHVRRHDWAIATVAAFTRCIFWFNPLAWWLERRLSALAEDASDEASVHWTGEPAHYAATLLHFAAAAQHGHRWLGGVAMARLRIRSRIDRVLAMRAPGNGIFSRAGWLAMILMATGTLYVAAAPQSTATMSSTAPAPAATAQTLQSEIAAAAASAIAALTQQPAPPTPPQPGTTSAPTPAVPATQTEAAPATISVNPSRINPDLVKEIRVILQAPGTNRYTGTAVWNVRNSALNPNSWNSNAAVWTQQGFFTFGLTGVEGRVVKFADLSGNSFSYGCPDCSFLVGNRGVSAAPAQTPGIEFQLSPDGKTLTATCRATECRVSGIANPAPVQVKPLEGKDVLNQISSPPSAGAANGDYQTFTTFTTAIPDPAPAGNPQVQNNPVLTAPAGNGIFRYFSGWDTGGLVCFSVFGTVKADGSLFTQADCPQGTIRLAASTLFSFR